jgi:hypothetical protein
LIFAASGCTPEVQEETERPAGAAASASGGRAAAPAEGATPEPAGGMARPDSSVPGAAPVAEGGSPAPAAAAETVEAQTAEESAVEKEAKKLLEELGEGFRVGIEGPFIVLGNIPEEKFREIMRYTIRACSDRMYKQYFDKKPQYTLKVYLFGDDQSYRQTAKRLWNDTNLSPFGYFKPSAKSLVMNIATGTGTLVHEMFHALVEPDFPDIPTWLNEGIASLYECCRVRDDGLEGMMNWRFPRLKEAVDDDELVPLKKLVATTTREFYGTGSDLHYSEARYFCMYMQEKGLLEKLYKKFRDNYDDDPTGKKFVEELFGKKLDEVEEDWVEWTKTLRYNR